MKRLVFSLCAAGGLAMLSAGCDNPNATNPNEEGITGMKPADAPTSQSKNTGTSNMQTGDAPKADPPVGQAFPSFKGDNRQEPPPGYPAAQPPTEGGGAAKPADGATKPAGEGEKASTVSAKDMEQIAKLSEADQKIAIAQTVCLISGEALGSMGVPIRVESGGKVGFLCCKGCKSDFDADPAKALAKAAK